MRSRLHYQLIVLVRLNIENDGAEEEQAKFKVRAYNKHEARRIILKRLYLEGYLVTRFILIEERKKKA